MKILNNKYLITLAAVCLLAGCDPKFSESVEDFEPSAGDADFSTFVVIGDSLSAGYKDGTLYREGQQNSYGKILSRQFAEVGGGSFRQPLRLPEATGSFIGIPTMGPGSVADRLVLIPNDDPERPVVPFPIAPSVPTALLPALTGLFNNFGVPGAKAIYAGTAPVSLTTFGDPNELGMNSNTANPFYVRFASAPNATLISDATLRAPTFFILWLGNNDILLNAVAGAPGTANPGFGTALTEVTPTGLFTPTYNALVAALTASSPGNKGILGNVPDVSTIPYFTTVPFDAVPLTAAEAQALNTDPTLMGYNMGIQAALGAMRIQEPEALQRTISFKEGQNAVLIIDDNMTNLTGFGPGLPYLRQATADDLILLPAGAKIGVDSGGLYGIAVGLVDGDVLTKTEKDAIETVRQSYNATIKAAADADPDLLLFDAAALLDELNETGLSYGSGGISSTFVQGNGFSLDGVHPTARGYAVIANEIIKRINKGFNANIAPVDPNEFSTVFYQQ